TGAVSREVAYYISSLRPNARRIGGAIRGHWGIENGLHWVLDVVFREDARRLYDRQAAEHVAFLNRLALSILRGDPTKASLKVKPKRVGWNIPSPAHLLVFLGVAIPISRGGEPGGGLLHQQPAPQCPPGRRGHSRPLGY